MTESPLMQTASGAVVDVSRDAGGFYCEHCLFSIRQAAADGTVVGFLHVPPDRFPAGTSQRRRHADTREVVAAALRGFLATSGGTRGRVAPTGGRVASTRGRVASTRGRVAITRVLLTGFRPWDKVVRNPSGDFVAHGGNVDAVVAALGGAPGGFIDGRRLAWVGGRALEIARAVLPVDDRAIDGGPLSVQAAIARHRPDFVLSMGVHRESARYRVEVRATDRRLRVFGTSGLAHDESVTTATVTLPDNDALARLIVSGSRPSTSTSTVSPPSATAPAPVS